MGRKPPTAVDIVVALTARPLLWTRMPAFQDVTLRECLAPLIQPRAQEQLPKTLQQLAKLSKDQTLICPLILYQKLGPQRPLCWVKGA